MRWFQGTKRQLRVIVATTWRPLKRAWDANKLYPDQYTISLTTFQQQRTPITPEMSPTRYSSRSIKSSSIDLPPVAKKFSPESNTYTMPCSTLAIDDNSDNGLPLSPPSQPSLASASQSAASSSPPITTSPSLSCSSLSPSSGSFAQSVYGQDHQDGELSSSHESSTTKVTKNERKRKKEKGEQGGKEIGRHPQPDVTKQTNRNLPTWRPHDGCLGQI